MPEARGAHSAVLGLRRGRTRVKPPEQTDEQLMAQLCRGAHDALAQLVVRYQNDIFRFCLHYLKDVERAQDLAQETFLRVYTACGRFDSSRAFRPWILCIARNLCLNELKRRKIVPMESLDAYSPAVRDGLGADANGSLAPTDHIEADERRAALMKALDALEDDARELVVLRFFERMSSREIAGLVGGTEGAIRTKLHRTLKSLRTVCGNLQTEFYEGAQ